MSANTLASLFHNKIETAPIVIRLISIVGMLAVSGKDWLILFGCWQAPEPH